VAVTVLFAVALTTGLVLAKPAPSSTCQRLAIASSAEKFGMLREFAAAYNRTAGRAVTPCNEVVVEQVNSGDAETALERGWVGLSAERPDVWAPASSAWVNLLSVASGDQAIRPVGTALSLFKSPLVIGVPKPVADALGYPAKPLGWKDIFSLVKDPAIWRATSRPEWGPFRLGKTNPTVSTSGLHALIGTYFAAPGTGLTVDRVKSKPVHDFVAGVEAGVVHYGLTAGDFLRNLRDASNHGQGLLYVSAVAIEEQELVDYNAGIIGGTHYGAPSDFLVPIYPSEGTPVADHPYVILNRSRQRTAEDFYGFLAKPEQQAVIDEHGFRTVGSADKGLAGPVLTRQRFIDANQPTLVLQPPQGAVLSAMLSAWHLVRKRARVLILVDAAAESELLKQATARLADAVSRFNPSDSAGVWVFPAPAGYATSYTELAPVAPVGRDLTVRLRSIAHTSDKPAVATSLRAAVDSLAAEFDPAAVDAVLLVELSPGGGSTADDLELQQYLRNQPVDHFVRVFTLGPDSQRLRDYALAGRGVAYEEGSTGHLLNDVISNF
jgi:Ca-activated chloride channel family protein